MTANEAPSPPESAAQPQLRKCRCGRDRNHPKVSPEPSYTMGGWLLILLMGATPDAVETRWKCSDCGEVLAVRKHKKGERGR